jgi:hypothetical protein
MRRFLPAGTALLGFTASGSVANAVPIDFTFTGRLVDFTVPTTDTYQIVAFGAQGGNGSNGRGGRGVAIGGDFSLTVGEIEILQIAVGGAGMSTAFVGGDSGSFVVALDGTPLVIAGGGGGGGTSFDPPLLLPGQDGLTGPDGGSIDSGFDGAGGTGGNGGLGGNNIGGGGGGRFLSAGGSGIPSGGSLQSKHDSWLQSKSPEAREKFRRAFMETLNKF